MCVYFDILKLKDWILNYVLKLTPYFEDDQQAVIDGNSHCIATPKVGHCLVTSDRHAVHPQLVCDMMCRYRRWWCQYLLGSHGASDFVEAFSDLPSYQKHLCIYTTCVDKCVTSAYVCTHTCYVFRDSWHGNRVVAYFRCKCIYQMHVFKEILVTQWLSSSHCSISTCNTVSSSHHFCGAEDTCVDAGLPTLLVHCLQPWLGSSCWFCKICITTDTILPSTVWVPSCWAFSIDCTVLFALFAPPWHSDELTCPPCVL